MGKFSQLFHASPVLQAPRNEFRPNLQREFQAPSQSPPCGLSSPRLGGGVGGIGPGLVRVAVGPVGGSGHPHGHTEEDGQKQQENQRQDPDFRSKDPTKVSRPFALVAEQNRGGCKPCCNSEAKRKPGS